MTLKHLVQLLVARITGSEEPDIVATVLGALTKNLPEGYAWPGNVRELEQAVRRILLTGAYTADPLPLLGQEETLLERLRSGDMTAAELLARYSALLYRRFGTYSEVAKRTGLDPRTSRKYVENSGAEKVESEGQK